MRVRNWKKFQHFNNRRPPWIKLHRDILDQRDINAISDLSFRVLIGLWLLASEDKNMDGDLPPIEDIAFRLRINKSSIMKALSELSPFLETDDITQISHRYQDDAPETETETETDIKVTICKFASFWKTCPRKIGKRKAESVYSGIVKRGEASEDELIAGMKAYAESVSGKETQYICHPATWLNQGRWMDEENKPIEIDDSEKAYNHLWMQNHLKRNGDPDLQEKDCPHPGNREEFKKKWAEGWRP